MTTGTTHLQARSDARVNRAKLLEAARQVFAERGIEVDVKAIAERAGLAVGTIYRHFPGKDELIAAVMEEASREFADVLTVALAEPDARLGLETFMHGGVAVLDRFGAVVSAVLEGRVRADRVSADLARRRIAWETRVEALVGQAQRAGVLRDDLPAALSAALLRAAFVPWVLGGLRREFSQEVVATGFLELFLHGAAGRTADSLLSESGAESDRHATDITTGETIT